MSKASILSQPFKFTSGREVPNRLTKAAMQECIANTSDNLPNESHFALYRAWAKGNWGIVLTGNVQIDNRYLGDTHDICISRDALDNEVEMRAWREFAASSKENNTIAIVQINHPGSQCLRGSGHRPVFGNGSEPIGPSEINLEVAGALSNVLFPAAREMTSEEVEESIKLFVNAAKVSKEAGFDGIELHAAHGYLISSFNNPKHNKRTDKYAYSTSIPYTMEVLREIRKACPKPFIVGIKLNTADTVSADLTTEDTMKQVETIASDEEAMVDFIEISGGTYEKPRMLETREPETLEISASSSVSREAFFAQASKQARAVCQRNPRKDGTCAIMLTGGFSTRSGMADAISAGHADLVGIGRLAAVKPQIPLTLLDESVPDTSAGFKYRIRGMNLMTKLIPLKVIGAGISTKWHVGMLGRISRGEVLDVAISVPGMIARFLWRSLKFF